MERNRRRSFSGKVISDKMDKTITVLVQRSVEHPVYKKKVKVSKKYKVHDEQNQARVGDIVLCMETRSLSKTKRSRLVKVLEKAIS